MHKPEASALCITPDTTCYYLGMYNTIVIKMLTIVICGLLYTEAWVLKVIVRKKERYEREREMGG